MELKNNSQEMKTVVETFVIEETAELIYDNEKLDRWKEAVETLGLTGQKQIAAPEKSPIPFMHMKQGLVSVFETLCPRKVGVTEYNATPIPVEILDLVALSAREGYFNRMEIWYDEKSPDPACIGVKSNFYIYSYDGVPKELIGKTFPSKAEALAAVHEISPDYKGSLGWETDTKHYLLGKWADVKQSFDELKERARKRFIEQEGNELRKKIKEAQRGLDDLETTAFDKFN